MPEFAFYCLPSDHQSLIESLLAVSGTLITPDIGYESTSPQYLRKWDLRLTKKSLPNRRVFLTGRFTREGLRMRMDLSGKYFVDELRGGPALSLVLPRTRTILTRTGVSPGTLLLPREFWGDHPGERIKPDEDVKEVFEQYRKAIKKLLKNFTVGKSLWVSSNALKALESKRVLLLVNGWWIDRAGQRLVSNLSLN